MLEVIALQQEFGTAVIMITHDLGVIAEVADDVVVMYAGAVMERPTCEIFFDYHHPYTEGLLRSLPAYGGERERLQPIPGQPPSLINLPRGCPFPPLPLRNGPVPHRGAAAGPGGEGLVTLGLLASARRSGARRVAARVEGEPLPAARQERKGAV